MHRRDFLKLAGYGLFGLLLPHRVTERIDMPIGDMLKKVALGQTLSQGEAEQLRLWGNKAELQSAYVGGLQTGQAEIDARSFPSPINLIYSKVFTVATANVVISIPGFYNHLWIITYGRIDGIGSYNTGLNAYVNGDTGNNYNHQNMSANGSSNGAQQNLNGTQFRIGYLAGGATAAGRACGNFCIIPRYNGSEYKHAILLGSATNFSDDTNVVADSIWNNTNPIKTLTVYAASGDNIDIGSIISVYGLL